MSTMHQLLPLDLSNWQKEKNVVLLDVREIDEYQEESIPESINIPLSTQLDRSQQKLTDHDSFKTDSQNLNKPTKKQTLKSISSTDSISNIVEKAKATKELNLDEKLVVHCRSGMRSQKFIKLLIKNGYPLDAWNLDGGIIAWKNANLPTL